MFVRFERDWRTKRAGEIAEFPGGVADLLIRRRIAVAFDAGPARGKGLRTMTPKNVHDKT